MMTLELTEDKPDAIALLPWSARLALRADRLDDLLPGIGSAQAAAQETGHKTEPTSGSIGAFAAIPLPLEAVLAEFDMALGRLERLRPGDHIPIPVAREIPLRIGNRIVARGRVGTCEDRMALRLTSGIAKGAIS
jgi:flagellar motor switch/type III secretory pathway protein FliN